MYWRFFFSHYYYIFYGDGFRMYIYFTYKTKKDIKFFYEDQSNKDIFLSKKPYLLGQNYFLLHSFWPFKNRIRGHKTFFILKPFSCKAEHEFFSSVHVV